MTKRPDLEGFLEAIGDVPAISDRLTVRRKSRDMTAAFSPVMRQEMKDKFADVVVRPRHKHDVLRIASAAARNRMPLIARGAGTANFGQGIPLRGGAMVDMTALDQVKWIKPGIVRAECGIRLAKVDEATRPHGFELRMFSSTKEQATLGGYVGGGHSGVGCCVYGILRDRGNIRALEVVSVEDEPKLVELRGDDVLLVHHAYGTNGLITELEMPLAPAWPWREVIVAFDGVMDAVKFSYDLAISDGIVKKLISILGAPIPQTIREMRPFGGASRSLVLCMIAEQSIESFEASIASWGGEIVSLCEEGQGAYGAPLYEFSWGHTRLQVNKEDPSIVGVIGLYASNDPVADIEKSERRFRHLRGLHFEVKRFDGRLSFQGSPYFPFVDDAQLAEVMRGMAEDGAMIANNHTFKVKQGGMKLVTPQDVAFKRRMDPYNLCNPGKMDFDLDEAIESAGEDLTDKTWSYRSHTGVPDPDAVVACAAYEDIMRNQLSRRSVIGGIAAASVAKPALTQTLDKLVYNTAWRAQAEAGGVFQAAATGIYRQHGIEIEIRQGGPQVDLNALLLAGRVDIIESNGFAAFNFARDNLPGVTIAALFQKDPRVLLSHKGVGNDTLAALKGKPILVATAGRTSYWLWLKAKYGYSDEQARPYTFNMAPFLADKSLTQQGLLTSEPFELKKIGVDPVIHLLADNGFEHYQNTIMTSPKLVSEKPDLVQRFVDATIKGWMSYLTADPGPGDAMIKQINPDMKDDTMAYARDAMMKNGIVSSGDAATLGIGAMSAERWQRFYVEMGAAGALPHGIDVAKTHTLQFVNKKVGVL